MRSYPKIYTLGHKYLRELLLDPVHVQEKIDGSQFSFGRYDRAEFGPALICRSKGAVIDIDAPDNMFSNAVEYVKSIEDDLTLNWTYRGEYLKKPKHNVLVYDRIPKNHIMLFDVDRGEEDYAVPVENIAASLGLEAVPTFFVGKIESADQFRAMLSTESVLGGQKIEGVVIKNYTRFGIDHKALFGKFVSEAFKEVHNKEWKAANPGKMDVVQALITSLHTPARWHKAVQHLRDAGKLEDSPRDIGLLMKEVPLDIEAEEVEYIKNKLFDWAWPHIRRGAVAGLPEYYKNLLMERQLNAISEQGAAEKVQ